MSQIQYLGENLWLGQIGHFAIILAFVTALLSAFSFFKAILDKEPSGEWKKIGRWSFYIHGISVFVLIGLIFYAMYFQMYEYKYVFDHVSPDLPMRYILSAFWEGQEGSFMLWMFWHIILGFIFIRSNYQMESPVMFIVVICQAILATMLLGFVIPWGEESFKIGSNPTVLLRQMMDAPIFNNANYLSLIKGGGLNPLLQNYWMTIHPPTLFLGFAMTIFPFGFAFGGLLKNDHVSWLNDAYKWSLFGAGILGIGILMGSFWAFEALSFGGYWNWDPVENASLVPWITLVAGLHTHMIARHTGHGLRSTYFYYIISFVLILYSTFLTRSGVLGDSSVHSFTQMGLEWQLVGLVSLFFILGLGLWIFRYKSIPNPKKEESLYSREFWMFIGSLVLLFSAILITTSTSLPVYNTIAQYFSPSFEGRVINDPISHYNKSQLWIAVFVAVLASLSLFLRYAATNWEFTRKKTVSKLLILAAVSIILTILFSQVVPLYSWQYYIFTFAGIFAMACNLDYLIGVARQKSKMAASAISHFGFGMMMAGLITSGLHAHYVSSNPFVFKGMFEDADLEKYVQLIKGKPLMTKGYILTYESDTLIDRERKYRIRFNKVDENLKVTEDFTLEPNALYSNDMSKVAAFNPDTRHYLHKDIFCCVVALPLAMQDAAEAKKLEDSLKFETFEVMPGDSLKLNTDVFVAESVSFTPAQEEYVKHEHDTGLSIKFSYYSASKDTTYLGETSLGLDGALLYKYPEALEDLGLRIRLEDDLMATLFTPEEDLVYENYTVKMGESFESGNYRFTLLGFDKNVAHRHYKPKDGDVAVAAKLAITNLTTNEKSEASPVYIIQDNVPMSLKNYNAREGLHCRFSNIDPASEKFSFKIARDTRPEIFSFKISVAKNVPRTDYVILEAKVFPGINLFWSGTLLMMFGLLLAWFYKKYLQKSREPVKGTF
ncbi:MAG: cytochrome c biogenesis protein CcsA [Saprospiraceae bacterium]|nr:cytochrome c biogenesis protein CcsA [Saprospiraceae bacterium]